jgi:hypothetical protein
MRQLLEREERHAVRADLISLEAACAVAFERIYGRHEDDSLARNTPEARNAIAHALVALTPIYTCDEERKHISQIDYPDLRGGILEEGGRMLAFPNSGRTAITRLAMRASAMSNVVDELSGMRPILEELTRNVSISKPSRYQT